MKKIICWLFGHDYKWQRISIFNYLNPSNKNLWKWRGDCRRCGDWLTAIPSEFSMNIPDKYPELKKFIRNHTRNVDDEHQ